MTVTIRPRPLCGTVAAPPSKSMGHRLLLAAGLGEGESVIHGISQSEDMKATLDVLCAMGARTRQEGDTVYLTGTDPRRATEFSAGCRESGSTLRFFIPLCLLSGAKKTLTGAPRLFERPLGIYEELCRERSLPFARTAEAVTLGGPLAPGEFAVPGHISSQFITGLLYALPLLAGDSTLTLVPPVESRSYIDMTVDALAQFGVQVEETTPGSFRIPGGQRFCPREAAVEGDWSNAAFFLALKALGHRVTLTGLPTRTRQGDSICTAYFEALSAGTPTLSLADCPDLGPILMAVAAAKQGCVLTSTRRLAMKESDRGVAMAKELSKFGVTVRTEPDTITVSGGLHPPKEPLLGHNDHRIVMALSTLCTLVGGTVAGAEAVRKSLPEYFSHLTSLGGDIHYEA